MRLDRVNSGREKGITMIEILVTLVIVSVGLLGAAAMVIKGLESNRNAYLRTQASILAYDMADRIRANRNNADSYDGFVFDSKNDAFPAIPACYSNSSSCEQSKIYEVDAALWARSLTGTTGGGALFPEIVATIEQTGDTFDITIIWQQVGWSSDDSEFNNVNPQFVLTFNL
jgi:type IV pilus assembly protein PilV